MHCQPTAFVIGQADPAVPLPAQDAVLFDQVGHGVLLPPVESRATRGTRSRRARRESLYHPHDLRANKRSAEQ
jgi:hypothetical protein